MSDYIEYLLKNKAQYIEQLKEFISIPSISSLAEHHNDVNRAALWVKSRLFDAGLENVAVMETGGLPAVYGDWNHAGSDKPTILIYGHFDVQPVDPLNLWHSDPFMPVIIDDKIFGRGASDDKGSMLTPILAAESFLKTEKKLPVNIKFLFEGQEEIGSPQMAHFIENHKEKFSCDMIFSADGGQWSETQPNLCMSLKGVVSMQLEVFGPSSDQHSGLHGAAIQNPISALNRILSSMKDQSGKICINDFYNHVIELSTEDKKQISEIPFSEEEYRTEVGVSDLAGEEGFSTLERIWSRPTLDLNGIWGGFQGEGIKTVLPSKACAKISCRLVANQDPSEIFECVNIHVKKNLPDGVSFKLKKLSGLALPFRIPANHKSTMVAGKVLADVYGKEPFMIRAGASIPILPIFKEILGIDATVLAFTLDDENLHAPNEFFRLSSFSRGQEIYGKLYQLLGDYA